MRHCSSSINYGGKRGVAHLPPRVRLRNCGAWNSTLLRNSNTTQSTAPGVRGQFRHRNSATAYAGSGASRPSATLALPALIRDAPATTTHTISAALQCGRPCARNRVTHCANARAAGKAQTAQRFPTASLTRTAASRHGTFVPPGHIGNAPWF